MKRILLLVVSSSLPLAAATKTWDGGDLLNTNWTDATNWSPNVAPVAGDSLVFPSIASSPDKATNNDFAAGTDFAGLAFTASGYSVAGNSFDLTANGIGLNYPSGSTTITPTIRLVGAGLSFDTGVNKLLLTTGALNLNGNNLTLTGAGTVDISGNITNSVATPTITQSGSGKAVMGGSNNFTGNVNVTAGILYADGFLAGSGTVTVGTNGTLAGSDGGIAKATTVTGTVAPGAVTDSTSMLEFNSLSFVSGAGTKKLDLDIQGTVAGDTYDRLTISSGGSITLNSANLALDFGSYTPPIGTVFTLINNASVSAISGTFTGIAQGASVVNGGQQLQFSYTGGTGNDFTATVLNRAPVANAQVVSTNEDTALPVTLTASDANGQSLTYTIVSSPTKGSLSGSGAGRTYTPNPNFNGSDSFTFRVNDGALSSNTAIVSITVNAVNDLPSFTKGGNETIEEDAIAQSFSWALFINDGDSGVTQALTFNVTNNNNALFAVQPAVSSSGKLSYTAATNAVGTATVSVSLTDDATAGGAALTTAVQSFTITLTPVNDVPSFINGANQTVLEDAAAQSITSWATALSSGPADESGQTLNFEITSNTNAALFAVAPAVASNGTLTYTPAANANGSATVGLRIKDSGGTANGGVDTSASQTFIISVTAVNDAPSFTGGSNQTVLEDAGLQLVSGWITSTSVGPANESGQVLLFAVTNDNAALFSSAPGVDGSGRLIYQTAPDAFGSATLSVTLNDNGGTSNGGGSASATQDFTLTVTPVNDRPSFAKGPNQPLLEDPGPQSIPGWATAIGSGPANESAQTFTFETVGNNNPTLFLVAPTISPSGTLTFTPAANAAGSATLTIGLRDSGGTANGSEDFSFTEFFTIDLTAVNDAPSFVKGPDVTVNEDADSQSLPGWATSISPGGTDEAGQELTFEIVSNDNPALFNNPPVVSSSGTLTFMAAANVNGTATIGVRLRDDGGTSNLGSDTSAVQTFVINALSVNDRPTFVASGFQTVAEDAGPQTVANWAVSMSSGPADEAGQTLSFEIASNSNPALFTDGPAVSSGGILTYTIGFGLNGSAIIGVRLHDNGGTDNGGVDVSATQNFIIDITPSNNQPTFTGGPSPAVLEDAGPQVMPNWATGISPGPPDESGQTINFVFNFNTAPELFSVQPAISSTGTLTFTPVPNAFGVANLLVEAVDSGGNSPGINTSVSYSFTITVTAVNDTPVATAQTLTAIRDVVLPVTLTASDVENNPIVLSVVTQPAHGTLSGTPPNLTYVPDVGYVGYDSFTYRGTDEDPGTPATVNITVGTPAIATGITRVWDGGAGTGLWSNPVNWEGDVAPQAGDSLEFPSGSTGVASTQNDLPAWTVFNLVRPAATQTLGGNGIVLLDGIESTGSVYWQIPLAFTQAGFLRTLASTPTGGLLTISAEVGVGPHSLTLEGAENGPGSAAPVTLQQRIFGSGNLVSRGIVRLSNSSVPTGVITGGVTVATGELQVSRSLGQRIVAAGPLEVQSDAILTVMPTFEPFDSAAPLTVRTGGFVQVRDFGSGTTSTLKVSSLLLEGGNVTAQPSCTVQVSGNVTATGPVASAMSTGSPYAALVFTAPSPVLDVAAGASFSINGFSGAFATGNVRKTGDGTLDLNGRIDFDGGLSVDAGDVRFFNNLNIGTFGLDAQETAVTLNGGSITGTSIAPSFARRIGSITSAAGGVLSPDPGFVEMRTLDLALNPAATCRFEIQDKQVTPTRHFDLMLVQGSINLGGAALEVILTPGSVVPAGETLVIIDNDGSDAVQGTFAGLPEGGVLTLGNVTMRVTYLGGDGNDVALKFGVNPTGITRVWDGGGNSNNWTDAGNWGGDVAPQSGDSLEFPSPSLRLQPFNDYPLDTAFHHVTFSGNGGAYSISGNPIRLSGGLSSLGSNDEYHAHDVFLCNVTCFADQSITKTGTRELFLVNWNTLGHALAVTDELANPPVQTDTVGIQIGVAGTGPVTVEGAGSVFLQDGLPIHSGAVQHRSGSLVLAQPGSYVNQRTGPMTVGGFGQAATVLTLGIEPQSATVPTTIAEGGTWICSKTPNDNFGSQTFDNLTLAGGNLTAGTGARIVVRDLVTALSGTSSTITGELRIAEPTGGAVDIVIGSSATVTISGATTSVNSISGSFLRKLGSGTLVMDAAMTCPRFDAVAGVSRFDGTAASTLIRLYGGTLAGSGAVGPVTSISTGEVAPGASPGTLATGAVQWNSGTSYAVEMAGATPGTGYDQLSVTGTVQLANATLAAVKLGGFVPTVGQSFVIINNDAAEAINGTFAGLAEGAAVSIGGQNFAISYAGGDGNDVVLTADSPAAPLVISSFSITQAGAGGGASDAIFTGSISGGPPNATAHLEASSDLVIWSVINTIALDAFGHGTFTNVTDPNTGVDPAARNRRFYRAKIQAP